MKLLKRIHARGKAGSKAALLALPGAKQAVRLGYLRGIFGRKPGSAGSAQVKPQLTVALPVGIGGVGTGFLLGREKELGALDRLVELAAYDDERPGILGTAATVGAGALAGYGAYRGHQAIAERGGYGKAWGRFQKAAKGTVGDMKRGWKARNAVKVWKGLVKGVTTRRWFEAGPVERLVELARGEQVAKLIGRAPGIVMRRGSALATEVAGSVRGIRAIDQIQGTALRASMEPRRRKLVKDLKGRLGGVLKARRRALADDVEAARGWIGVKGTDGRWLTPRVTRESRAAYGLLAAGPVERLVELARARNSDGSFAPDEAGGADPGTMSAAYGDWRERVSARARERMANKVGGGAVVGGSVGAAAALLPLRRLGLGLRTAGAAAAGAVAGGALGYAGSGRERAVLKRVQRRVVE